MWDLLLMYLLKFGFDHVSSDYKLVRIVQVEDGKKLVELFKLSTGRWKDISHVALSYYTHVRSSRAYVNGAISIGFDMVRVETMERDSSDLNFCVWIMERYGVADSWTMIIRIDLALSILTPEGFGINNEVLVVDRNQWLVSLDFKNWRIKVLEVQDPSSSVKWLSLYVFFAELSPDSFLESLDLFSSEEHLG
ncbi:hypothetical protein ACH5RR_028485 [Cinchona calisaya]|uniref:F-box associated domain-containing protein n=1 Tax=Cinchona calisaya TaxID=153742 RepID=A0ABD2YNY0_9GENT